MFEMSEEPRKPIARRPLGLNLSITTFEVIDDLPLAARAYHQAESALRLTGPRWIAFPKSVPTAIGAAYAAMIAAFWIGFGARGDLLLPMLVVTLVLGAFIGIPWTMDTIRLRFLARHCDVPSADSGFRRFRTGAFEIETGVMPAGSAALLVLSIPVVLATAAIALAVVYRITS